MPFKSRFLILCGIAVFLCLTLAVGLLLQSMQRSPAHDHFFLAQTSGIENYDKIAISAGKNNLEFSKNQGKWVLYSGGDLIPVRSSRIEDFIKSLKSMNSLRIAAQTAQGYDDLKINDAQSIKLDLQSGSDKASIWFGDVSQDGSEQYVRESKSPIVYAVKAGIAFWLQQEANYWFERRIWPDDLRLNDIVGVEYQSKKVGSLKLSKQSKNGVDSWLPEGSKPDMVKKERIAAWIQSLIALEGDELKLISSDQIPADFKPASTLHLMLASKRNLEVTICAPAKKDDKWLMIPRYEGANMTKNGMRLAILVPEWKLDLAALGE